MKELTKRQSEIYQFIKHIVQTKGYPPSVREIGLAVGLASSSTVHGHSVIIIIQTNVLGGIEYDNYN